MSDSDSRTITGYVYEIAQKNAPADDENRYIGSTFHPVQRRRCHVTFSVRKPHVKLYSFVNNNGGWENFHFKVLEEVVIDSALSKAEKQRTLQRIERKFIDTVKCALNVRKPMRHLDDGNRCEHGVIWATCRPCKGRAICDHGKIKQTCRVCKPESFCRHNRYLPSCRDCRPQNFCAECSRIKATCRCPTFTPGQRILKQAN